MHISSFKKCWCVNVKNPPSTYTTFICRFSNYTFVWFGAFSRLQCSQLTMYYLCMGNKLRACLWTFGTSRALKQCWKAHTESQSWCSEGRWGVEGGKCLSCPRKVLHAYSCVNLSCWASANLTSYSEQRLKSKSNVLDSLHLLRLNFFIFSFEYVLSKFIS